MMPEVNSVWRKGDEWRRVREIGEKSVWFDEFGDEDASLFADWHAWAADAVQVWPQPETPQPVGETVRVWAAVLIDKHPDDGSPVWQVCGGSDQCDDEMEFDAREFCEGSASLVAFIEADIPIPQVPTVNASVETP